MRFISGLKNCHVRGVDSLVISDRESDEIGMVRVFHATPGHELREIWKSYPLARWQWCKPADEFSLAPHNHRQDISLELIYGQVNNWTMAFAEKGDSLVTLVTEYQFYSGILGKMGVTPLRTVGFYLSGKMLPMGIPVHMLASRIHTVQVVSPSAAWIVREGKLSDAPSLAYNCEGWQPTSDGLYIPMDEEELAERERFFTLMGATA